jgi:hypothetical protein
LEEKAKLKPKPEQSGAVLIYALILVALSTLSVGTLWQQLIISEKRMQMNGFWLQADEILDNEATLQLRSIKRNADDLWNQLQQLQRVHLTEIPSKKTTVQGIYLESIQQPMQARIEAWLMPASNNCLSEKAIYNFQYLCLKLKLNYITDHLYDNQTSSITHFVLFKAGA